jgi:hypothetical protein
VGDKGTFAALVSAIIHDYRHPGYTNQFMINSDHELALTYNDQSVLENFHLAEAFKLMKLPEYNIFSGVSRETYFTIFLSLSLSLSFSSISQFLS